MANKKLRFVALIVVALALVCMLVACTTTTTKANYNVIIHLGDGQSDITWDRQADFPTLSREHYLEEGLYLDAEFKTATTREDLKAMWLTSDIDVYVNWTKIIYKITVHPANGAQDVIWEPAPGNKIPAFTKVGYIMDGFYFDENCTQSADSVFAEELLEHKEVWVKWVECDHKAVTEWTVDKDATCTEDGHKIATCPTCAKELEDTITALGHNSDGVVTHKDADCINDGVVGGTYCTRCELGKEAAEKVIPALGHEYGEVSYVWSEGNKTCTASRTCANDASHVETETVNVKATVVQNKTCTLDELTTYVATFENSAFAPQTKANIKTADKTGHKYGDVSYEWSSDNKTCTASRSCTNADCTHAETETVETKATVTQHSSCTTVELTTYVATFENSAFAEQKNENVQTANAGEHNYTEFVKHTQEPTCTEGGKAIYKCGGCSGTKEIDVDALGHNSDGKVEHKDADCINDGVVGGSYCTRCGLGKEAAEKVIPAGHTYGDWTNEVPATCTSTGTVAHKDCTVCHKHFDNEGNEIADENYTIEKDANNHTYGDLIDKVPESCTTDGKAAHYHCACGQYFNESKEAVEESALTIKAHHSYGDTSIVWNDDHTAFVATRTCANCTDDVVGHTQTATSTEHSVYAIATQPTCTEAGTADYIVTFNADWIEGEQTVSAWYPAKGHSYTKQVATQDYLVSNATCTAKAVYYYSCECGAIGTETFEYGELGSHNYGEWIKKVDPSCLEEGTLGHYHCSVCEKNFDAEYAELNSLTIDKADHTTQHTEKVDATCSEDGNIEYWYCTGCETYFSDEACTKTITVNEETDGRVIPATGKHAYKWIAVVPATETENGTKGHWECKDCGKVFNENYAEVQLDSLSFSSTDKDGYTLSISINDYATNLGWGKSSGNINNGRYFNVLLGEVAKFKLECTDSNSGKWFSDGWRTYLSGGCTYTIATEDGSGYQIDTVKITYSGSKNGTLKNGTTSVTTGDVVDVNDKSITLSIGGSSGAQVKITGIEVVYSVLTDADKAQAVANGLSLSGNYSEDFDLPTTSVSGATITWESDNDCVTIDAENNKARVTTPATEQEVKLTATIKCGEATASKDFTVTILVSTEQFTITVTQPTGGTVSVTIDGTDVVSGNEYDKGSVLTITATPSTGYGLVKITVNGDKYTNSTLTLANNVAITAVFELTRTEENPYSIDGENGILNSEIVKDLASNAYTSEQMYVVGIVDSIGTVNPTYVQNIVLVDEVGNTIKFKISSCSFANDINAIYVGDTIIVKGYIKYTGTEYQMAGTSDMGFPTFIDRIAGRGTVTVADGSSDKATVSDITPSTGDNGATFTFKVAVADTNYTLSDVQVNGTSVKASYDETAGTYTGTIVGATTIKVITKDANSTEPTVVATFEFGDNSTSASHNDGKDVGETYKQEVGEYALELTSCSKVSSGAYDAKGNSALKLGTGDVVGSFTFTAPDKVTKVIIYVAKYKAKNTTVNINGTDYTINTSSNDGSYTAIEVDVSTAKTVTLATVKGKTRCMIDKIEFYA